MYSQPQDIDILPPAASAILEHHLAYGREAGIVVTYFRKLSVLPYQTGASHRESEANKPNNFTFSCLIPASIISSGGQVSGDSVIHLYLIALLSFLSPLH